MHNHFTNSGRRKPVTDAMSPTRAGGVISGRVVPSAQGRLVISAMISGSHDACRGLDEGEVGERLGEVSEVPAGVDVEFLGVEPER